MIGKNRCFRSTRGASKQRRDQINDEVKCLRDLLPFSTSRNNRFFQLQIMALSCVFIRKHHFLPYKKIPSIAKKKYCDSSGDVNDHMRNLLCSFVLAFTDSGKITFMENTDQFLVVPPDELLSHTDSVFDLVDQKDHPSLWNLLNGTDSERQQIEKSNTDLNNNNNDITPMTKKGRKRSAFVWRLNPSRLAKKHANSCNVILSEGFWMDGPSSRSIGSLFVARCRPLLTSENVDFCQDSLNIIHKVSFSLGFRCRPNDFVPLGINGFLRTNGADSSFYELIHPEDVKEVSSGHQSLVHKNLSSFQCKCRLLSEIGSVLWVNAVFVLSTKPDNKMPNPSPADGSLCGYFQILSELEASAMRNLGDNHLKPKIPTAERRTYPAGHTSSTTVQRHRSQMEPPPKPHNYQPSYSPCIINVYNHFQLYPPRYCWSNAELPELRESEIDDFFRRVEEMSKPLRGTPPQDQNNNNISILGNKTYS